jgi:peptidyl-prolyl cis-trans isomerase A (cyclophilin A)/peptidyl-prolyl cis-trans isomerase B (cyclophilin B)
VKRFLIAAVLGLALASPTLAQEGGQAVQPPGEAAAPAETPAIVEAPAPDPADPAAPVWTGPEVTLQTSLGDIVVVLDTVGAPKTAAQFLKLVRNGHYNGSAFYRIEKGFVIQFGDLDAKLKYRPANLSNVPLETANNKHRRGALSLARADEPGSGQSTIFISLGENSGLDAKADAPPNTTGYAAFGHVVSGMEVVDAIAGVELAAEGGPFPGKLPKAPVVVKKAAVTKKE